MINFNDTEKKLECDPKVMAYYKELEPKYSIIRSMVKARIDSGLSQEEIARRMETSQSSIARLESGNQMPSLNTLFKYAKATGTIPVINFI
jgi:DNA-binding XRE family transcriptional regulator